MHVASDPALRALTVTLFDTGLLLGVDQQRRPVAVDVFRPEPTKVALIGGAWLSRILVLRALALGARVAILTAAPDKWAGFGEWAVGGTSRLVVLPLDKRIKPKHLGSVASAQEPVLLLYEADTLPPPAPAELGPWQAQVTVLSQLTGYGLPVVQEATMVIAQRLARPEAEILTSALWLEERTTYGLQVLDDDVVGVLRTGEERYARVRPTPIEQDFGRPRRG